MTPPSTVGPEKKTEKKSNKTQGGKEGLKTYKTTPRRTLHRLKMRQYKPNH
jgi:hypothetical protein